MKRLVLGLPARTILAFLVIVCGALVLAGRAAPAVADSGSGTDERGDAPARVDITGLHVENGNRWFSMRVEVRNLRQKGNFQLFYEEGRRAPSAPPHRGALIIVHRVAGETRARWLGCSREDCSAEPGEGCGRLRASWNTVTDVIRVEAPHACLWWLQRHPDQSPPRTGTFDVYSYLGRLGGDGESDGIDPVVVDRG